MATATFLPIHVSHALPVQRAGSRVESGVALYCFYAFLTRARASGGAGLSPELRL